MLFCRRKKNPRTAPAEDRNSTTTMVKLMGTRNEIRTEPARTIYLSYLFGHADRGRRRSGGYRRAPRLWTRHTAEFRSAWRSRSVVSAECVPRVASLADALTRARALTRTVGRSRPHTHAQVVPPEDGSFVSPPRFRVSLALSCKHARTHATGAAAYALTYAHAYVAPCDVMMMPNEKYSNIILLLLLPSGSRLRGITENERAAADSTSLLAGGGGGRAHRLSKKKKLTKRTKQLIVVKYSPRVEFLLVRRCHATWHCCRRGDFPRTRVKQSENPERSQLATVAIVASNLFGFFF